jgi:hypothetical protein
VSPRAGLDGCGKSRPPPGFDPGTVQPVASRYTDRAIPSPRLWYTITHMTFCSYLSFRSSNPEPLEELICHASGEKGRGITY